jgi:SAM-dependent methyltransferase
LLERAGIVDTDTVLEVGAGMGRYTALLAGAVGHLVAIDISEHLLHRLADLLPDDAPIELLHADASDPPPRLLQRFDGVVGFFVLHHIHDLLSAFSGMARTLGPAGTVAFVEPNPFNLLYYVQILVTPHMTLRGDRGMLGMRPGPVGSCMVRAGLVPRPVARFGAFPPALYDRSRLLRRIDAWLGALPVLRRLAPFQVFAADMPRVLGRDS